MSIQSIFMYLFLPKSLDFTGIKPNSITNKIFFNLIHSGKLLLGCISFQLVQIHHKLVDIWFCYFRLRVIGCLKINKEHWYSFWAGTKTSMEVPQPCFFAILLLYLCEISYIKSNIFNFFGRKC